MRGRQAGRRRATEQARKRRRRFLALRRRVRGLWRAAVHALTPPAAQTLIPRAIVALGCVALLLAALPTPALARTITFPNGGTATLNADGSISGTARIVCDTSYESIMETDGTPTRFAVTMPDGSKVTGYCLDYLHVAPADGTYPFRAVPQSGGRYKVTIDSSKAATHPIMYEYEQYGVGMLQPAQKVGDFSWKPTFEGKIHLAKVSSNEGLTSGNSCYSLKGAEYGVYTDESCATRVALLTTNAKGEATSANLPSGTYYVREVTAPAGYAKDDTVYKVEVKAGKTVEVKAGGVAETPLYGRLGMVARKTDAEQGLHAQGDASLAGAEFTVRFYAGSYTASNLPSEPERAWTVRTDESGIARLDEEHLVSGDEPYTQGDTPWVLPLGTLTIQETKAPEGYALGEQPAHVLHINASEDGTKAQIAYLDEWPAGEQVVADDVLRGGISVAKVDAENGTSKPQGSATLAGAEYTIRNASAASVVVDGVERAPGEDVATIVTSEDGTATTSADLLPYGTYEVYETKPPTGYLPSSEEQVVEVRAGGEIVACSSPFAEQVVRGDLFLRKVEGGSMEPLAGVPLLLTSQTTGEAHVLVTDENGMAGTASDWFARGDGSTNTSDGMEREPGAIWFAGRTDEALAPVTNERGALPYDTYELEELPCEANEGHVLIRRTVRISRNAVTLDLGTIDDEPVPQPLISTSAHDGRSNGDEALSSTDMLIVDDVTYENLEPGASYTISATLMDTSTGEAAVDAAGNPIVAEIPLVPSDSSGSVQVSLAFDGSSLAGHDLVCFERLLDAEGNVVALHEDLSDRGQTVSVPRIATTAEAEGGGHVALASPDATIVDTVAYENLTPGREYQLTATLVDPETGEVLKGSRPATSSFIAEAGSSTAQVSIPVDASGLAGRSIVVFEEVSFGGHVVAEHKDATDGRQTISFPAIATTAHVRETGTSEGDAQLSQTIEDTVHYEGLVPGEEYRLLGTLVARETGEPLADSAGAEVHGAVSFVPEASSGEVVVSIPVPAGAADSADAVVFEQLYQADTLVAEHADANSSSQRVALIRIGTVAKPASGASQLELAENAQIVDTVSYQGLAAGETYRLEGIVVRKDTGEPMLDAEGNPVSAQAEFVPGERDGTTELVFELDTRELAGTELVVFETLFHGDVAIAYHQDLSSSSQTVAVSQPPDGPNDTPPEPTHPSQTHTTGKGVLPQTGQGPIVAACVVLGVAAGIGAVRIGRRRSSR